MFSGEGKVILVTLKLSETLSTVPTLVSILTLPWSFVDQSLRQALGRSRAKPTRYL